MLEQKKPLYEREVRGWFRLDPEDQSNGHHFYRFSEHVILKEVIAGPLCTTTTADIEAALVGYPHVVTITKGRLAFTLFRIVKNKKGFAKSTLVVAAKLTAISVRPTPYAKL